MNKREIILDTIIIECNKHAEMLDYSYGKMEHLFPFTVENVRRLRKEDISHLDQYIFRFSKLQDAIGQKLFKAVLRLLGEEVSNKPFIDVFNRLEQLGIIEDYDTWNNLRGIRNEIAHEYDENKQELAEKLNRLIESGEPLKGYLNSTLHYLKDKGLWH